MAYIGSNPHLSTNKKLDAITFDGVQTSYTLRHNGIDVYPSIAEALTISINGIIQEPRVAYTVASNQIVFSEPPLSGSSFFGVILGERIAIPYLPDGAANIEYISESTVSTNVQNKLREILSVKDFGAVGDGVADDTAAIQAAVNYVGGLSGGNLLFPSGTYKVSNVIDVSYSNVSIVGSGRNVTKIVQTDQSKNSFSVTGHYFSIRSLQLLYQSQANAGVVAFDVNGAFYSYVSDLYVHKPGIGFRYRNSANSNQINNFVVEDATTSGVTCLGITANVIAQNFQILNANQSLCADGCIRLEGNVEGCNFVNGHTYGGAVSLLTSAASLQTGASPLYNKFHAVYFDNAVTGGILNNTGELDFIDCWWSARPSNGLYIAAVDGIRFTNGGAFNCAQHGALVESSASRVTFTNWMSRTNSTETANTYDGIHFAGTSGFSVIGGTFTNTGVALGGLQRYGITIASGCNNFIVRDCNMIGNATGAILDLTSDYAADKTISGNIGYKTSNTGAVIIPAGQTSVVVNHGLNVVPPHQSIMLTRGVTNSGSIDLFVDSNSINSTQFTIQTAPAPTSDITIIWHARCKGA